MVGKSRGTLIDSTRGRTVPKGKLGCCSQEKDGVQEGRTHGCLWQISEIFRGWKYIHAKCLAQKRKEGASGYLTKDVGKFTEEAVFTPCAFLQGQRT